MESANEVISSSILFVWINGMCIYCCQTWEIKNFTRSVFGFVRDTGACVSSNVWPSVSNIFIAYIFGLLGKAQLLLLDCRYLILKFVYPK